MLNRSLIILKAFLVGSLSASLTASLAACGPPPDVRDDAALMDDSGISREVFLQIAEELRDQYQPDVEAAGARLQMRAQWDEERFGAASAKSRGTWLLMIYGGTARAPGATPDALALIVCHEWGHLIGGPPFMREELSAEGQADWFATRTCLPRLWSIVAEEHPDDQTSPPDDSRLDRCIQDEGCRRVLRASEIAMQMSAERHNHAVPSLDARDPSIAPETIRGYPSPQCRLDTMVAGALGLGRPACWFRPE
jgi:hypothetical protein